MNATGMGMLLGDGVASYALWVGLLGVVFALVIYRGVASQPAGSSAMQFLADQIHAGAMAFLRREYTVLLPFLLVVAALLSWALGWETGVAYIAGGLCSVTAGYAGMTSATKANVRTSEAARASGQAAALRVAFNGGAVMGLAVASLGLVGIGAMFMWQSDKLLSGEGVRQFAEIISGFAMGASSIALFARVGGGIYTKAADVGADLVGKVEAGIPEDDPRNPATIADNVGDNVGDVAGLGADIFESYVGAMIATIALAATSPLIPAANIARAMSLPVVYTMTGLVASLVGIFLMRIFAKGNPANALRMTTFVAAGLFLVFAYFVTINMPLGMTDAATGRVYCRGRTVLGRAGGLVGRYPDRAQHRVLHRRQAGHPHRRSRRRPARPRTSSPAWRSGMESCILAGAAHLRRHLGRRTTLPACTAWPSPRSACWRRSA